MAKNKSILKNKKVLKELFTISNTDKQIAKITLKPKLQYRDKANQILSESGHDHLEVDQLTFGPFGKVCVDYEEIYDQNGIAIGRRCVKWR